MDTRHLLADRLFCVFSSAHLLIAVTPALMLCQGSVEKLSSSKVKAECTQIWLVRLWMCIEDAQMTTVWPYLVHSLTSSWLHCFVSLCLPGMTMWRVSSAGLVSGHGSSVRGLWTDLPPDLPRLYAVLERHSDHAIIFINGMFQLSSKCSPETYINDSCHSQAHNPTFHSL